MGISPSPEWIFHTYPPFSNKAMLKPILLTEAARSGKAPEADLGAIALTLNSIEFIDALRQHFSPRKNVIQKKIFLFEERKKGKG